MAFFGTTCDETLNDVHFGLRDGVGQAKAYATLTDPTLWVATLVNTVGGTIVFTPIDYCIIINKPGTTQKESTCDAMLAKGNALHLIELKERKSAKKARSKGIKQLKNTIRLLKLEPIPGQFTDRQAHVCNRLHPAATLNMATNKQFLKETGFRLGINATIAL